MSSNDRERIARTPTNPDPVTLDNEAGRSVFFLDLRPCRPGDPPPARDARPAGARDRRHIAWDIGIGAVGQTAVAPIGRGRGPADLFAAGDRLQPRPQCAELDPGNQRGDRDPRQSRSDRDEHALPGSMQYSAPITMPLAAALDRRAAAGRASVLVALHSFTPVFKGVARPWHAAVLYNRDAVSPISLSELLSAEDGLDRRRERALRGQRSDRLYGPGAWRAARPAACRDRDPPGPNRRPGGPDRLGRAPGAAAACGLCRVPAPMTAPEPRGADRSGPRGIADHRRPELLHRDRRPARPNTSAVACGTAVLPNIRRLQLGLPQCRHRGRLFGHREHDPRWPRPQPRLQDLGHRCAARLAGTRRCSTRSLRPTTR